jgi:hypothetical protein
MDEKEKAVARKKAQKLEYVSTLLCRQECELTRRCLAILRLRVCFCRLDLSLPTSLAIRWPPLLPPHHKVKVYVPDKPPMDLS